jgi:hypothetical protein
MPNPQNRASPSSGWAQWALHGDLARRAGFDVTGCDVSADPVARLWR